jgi:hypothetical protein
MTSSREWVWRSLEVVEISRGHVSVSGGAAAMRGLPAKKKFGRSIVTEKSSGVNHVLTRASSVGDS